MKNSLLIILIVFLLTGWTYYIHDLPTDQSNLFSGSGNCVLCHTGSPGIFINASGRDVSPVYHWQSSMMGNASKDPYWQAKVSSEVEENFHLKEIIEDKCATCHAPMGRTEAIYNGQNHFSLEEVQQDPLSQDGVSCLLCHQIDSVNLGDFESFSGNYDILPTKQAYGPYQNPFTNSMVNNTGYTPSYSVHIESSKLCATCHTLITPYVDQNGDIAGLFPEQMPYFEWLNSDYPNQELTCQKCHMPRVNEDFIISAKPPSLSNIRNPVFEHHFVGGNQTINSVLKNNYKELGINSGIENLDTTQFYTEKNLYENTIQLDVDSAYNNGMVSVFVRLKNKTGHKLPTGFPSRRLWIHFTAKDGNGSIIFESGNYNEKGEILSLSNYEFHHDTIANQNQVQVYEAVMGNTQNQETVILLEASQYLKDNRIPPAGFVSGMSYDSLISVTGFANSDPNFNKTDSEIEGTGADLVTYYFPFSGTKLVYDIKICYQSIKPNFANHIDSSLTDESVSFSKMYADTSINKVHVISAFKSEILLSDASNNDINRIKVSPNPTNGKVFINNSQHTEMNYSINSIEGKMISIGKTTNNSVILPIMQQGIFVLQLWTDNEKRSFKLVYN